MRVIIVEDEGLAAERLENLIHQYDSKIEILAHLDSVEDTVQWLKTATDLDLAFMDIQLADGLSFEIFDQALLPCPVIFTTAYDEYTLKAFKVNSIDYLLKPIDFDDLTTAMEQYQLLKQTFKPPTQTISMEAIQSAVTMMNQRYKSRFIVKAGHHLHSVPVEKIAYFYHENKTVWCKKLDQKKHAIDYTLEQLESLLDPRLFFRLNRKYIVSFPSIKEVVTYSNSRLKVQLIGVKQKEDIVISRDRVAAFKAWLDQ